MRISHNRKFLAALTAAAMGIVSLPTVISSSAADDVIYTTGFEAGEEIVFTGRGGVEVLESSTEQVHGGDAALCVSGREKSWNGPQLLLDDICEPGVEYIVSAWGKSEWYSTFSLSMEYTDTEGTRHYSNLQSFQGDAWNEFSEVKFSFSADQTNVYIYFECSDATCKMYIDDFTIAPAPVIPIQEDIPSLSEVYANYFKIGTAITPSALSSKSQMDLVEKHFSESITLGNEMKPDSVLSQDKCIAVYEETGDDTNPPVSFGAAKSVLNYCIQNDIPVRAHTLVWHSQTPDWFFREGYASDGEWVSKDVMIARMENYIKNYFETLAAEYPELEVYACDVVNEAWLDNGSPRIGGTQAENANYSGWVKVFGDNSFIEYAFTFARQYAPEGCKLYYNDFNEYMPSKTTAIVEMATDLKEKGLIDGIGCQSHLDVSFPGVSVYEKAIAAFAETGLDIQITELDVTISKDQPTDENFATQAQYYSDIMDVLVKYSDNISAVVFWGLTDDGSWRANQYPLLFDEEYQAKPAFYSIVDGLELPDTTTTTTTGETTTGTGTYTLLGDVNCDGWFMVNDVILLNRFLAEDKTATISETGLLNADFDQNGERNGDDATAMLMSLASLTTD